MLQIPVRDERQDESKHPPTQAAVQVEDLVQAVDEQGCGEQHEGKGGHDGQHARKAAAGDALIWSAGQKVSTSQTRMRERRKKASQDRSSSPVRSIDPRTETAL